MDGKPNSLPGTLLLDEYAFARVEDEVSSTSRDKTKLVLEGLISTSFYSLALGDDDRAVGFDHFAQKVWARYRSKTSESGDRISLPPLEDIKKDVLQRLLDPERGFNSQLADQLRTRLNLPAPTNAPPAATSPKQ